jgi:phosphohistidine phosphatase
VVSDDVPSVMMIGHNPGMQELALSLAGRGPALSLVREGFVTGALATLVLHAETWRALDPGAAEVVAFVTPKQLA